MQLFLMGLRGAGKSTVGRALAARTGLAFVDLDERTAAGLGCASVSEAWKRFGEPAFRAAEVAALRAVLAEGVPIVALGGGTAMTPEAAAMLRDARARGAKIVYLRASAVCLASRLRESGAGDRPSLTGRGVVEEVAEVLAARDAAYLGLADLVLEVGAMREGEVVERLVGAME